MIDYIDLYKYTCLQEGIDEHIFKAGNGRRYIKLIKKSTKIPLAIQATDTVATHQLFMAGRGRPKYCCGTIYSSYDTPYVLNFKADPNPDILYATVCVSSYGKLINVADDWYSICTWKDFFGYSIKESQLERIVNGNSILYLRKLDSKERDEIQEAYTRIMNSQKCILTERYL